MSGMEEQELTNLVRVWENCYKGSMKSEAMRTLTISLTPKQAARLQDAVDSGGYASNSEIVREALRMWEHREELRVLELAQLKRAYDEGMASGEGQEVDRSAFLSALKAERSKRG